MFDAVDVEASATLAGQPQDDTRLQKLTLMNVEDVVRLWPEGGFHHRGRRGHRVGEAERVALNCACGAQPEMAVPRLASC